MPEACTPPTRPQELRAFLPVLPVSVHQSAGTALSAHAAVPVPVPVRGVSPGRILLSSARRINHISKVTHTREKKEADEALSVPHPPIRNSSSSSSTWIEPGHSRGVLSPASARRLVPAPVLRAAHAARAKNPAPKVASLARPRALNHRHFRAAADRRAKSWLDTPASTSLARYSDRSVERTPRTCGA
ncbi:hypothetical protein FB451DRAFT_1401209 [Mycena latifolia]|nr:hypothetical protein FB451DRAFT_1401209 [Mycena latifolia]